MSHQIRAIEFNNKIGEVKAQITKGAQGARYNVLKDGAKVLDIVKDNKARQVSLTIRQKRPVVNGNIYNILKNNGFNISTINVNGVSVKLQGETPTLQISNLGERHQAFQTIKDLSEAPFSTEVRKINVESPVQNADNLRDFINSLPNGVTANFTFQGKAISLAKVNGAIADMTINGMGVSPSAVRPSIQAVNVQADSRKEVLDNIALLEQEPFNINISNVEITNPVQSPENLATLISSLPNGKTASFSYKGNATRLDKDNGASITVLGENLPSNTKELLVAIEGQGTAINSLRSHSFDLEKNGLERILIAKGSENLISEFPAIKNLEFFKEAGSKAIFCFENSATHIEIGNLARLLQNDEEIRISSNRDNNLSNHFSIKLDGRFISCEANNTTFDNDQKRIIKDRLISSGFSFRPNITHPNLPTRSDGTKYGDLGVILNKLHGHFADDTTFQTVSSHRNAKTTFDTIISEYTKGRNALYTHVEKKATQRHIQFAFHPDKIILPESDDKHKLLCDMYACLKYIGRF